MISDGPAALTCPRWQTQLSERQKWDAAQMPAFARQQAYLERLRNRRAKGSNHWTIGYDMAYY
jgi:hypothetical protein